jgi:hypothetical protein
MTRGTVLGCVDSRDANAIARRNIEVHRWSPFVCAGLECESSGRLFEKPVRLPKGSSIKVQAVYDNSDENPKNPNSPPKPVHWGEQTTDEMCLCGVQVFTDTISDLKKVAAMRGNELGAGLDGGVPGLAGAVKKEAVKKAAKLKESKQASSVFPADGYSIPERFKPALAHFDTDSDGKLSREEFEKMPAPLQERLDQILQLRQSAKGK